MGSLITVFPWMLLEMLCWRDYSHTLKQSQHFTSSNCHPRKPWVTLIAQFSLCVYAYTSTQQLLLLCQARINPLCTVNTQVSSEVTSPAVISFCGNGLRCLHFPPLVFLSWSGLNDQRRHNNSEPDDAVHGQEEMKPCDVNKDGSFFTECLYPLRPFICRA